MGTTQGIRRGRPERWRTPALVTGSVVFHAVVLGVLGLRSVEITDSSPPQPPLLYLDIEPRPMLKDEAARIRTPRADNRSEAPFQRDRTVSRDQDSSATPTPPAPRLAAPATDTPAPAATETDSAWMVRPEASSGPGLRGPRANSLTCRSPQFLTPAERIVCDDRFGLAAARTAPMTGSGDPDTDARFAREGNERLAAYASRREALTPGRAPCPETRSPIGDCGVEIKVDIWSSREGFLPRQRRDD